MLENWSLTCSGAFIWFSFSLEKGCTIVITPYFLRICRCFRCRWYTRLHLFRGRIL
eukprot:UN00741